MPAFKDLLKLPATESYNHLFSISSSTYRKSSIKRRGAYQFHRDFGAAFIRGAALITRGAALI